MGAGRVISPEIGLAGPSQNPPQLTYAAPKRSPMRRPMLLPRPGGLGDHPAGPSPSPGRRTGRPEARGAGAARPAADRPNRVDSPGETLLVAVVEIVGG